MTTNLGERQEMGMLTELEEFYEIFRVMGEGPLLTLLPTKRMLQDCVSRSGSIDNGKFMKAVLQCRNTPHQDCRRTRDRPIYQFADIFGRYQYRYRYIGIGKLDIGIGLSVSVIG